MFLFVTMDSGPNHTPIRGTLHILLDFCVYDIINKSAACKIIFRQIVQKAPVHMYIPTYIHSIDQPHHQ